MTRTIDRTARTNTARPTTEIANATTIAAIFTMFMLPRLLLATHSITAAVCGARLLASNGMGGPCRVTAQAAVGPKIARSRELSDRCHAGQHPGIVTHAG